MALPEFKSTDIALKVLDSIRKAAVRGMVYFDVSGDEWACDACKKSYYTVIYGHHTRPVFPQCVGCRSFKVAKTNKKEMVA